MGWYHEKRDEKRTIGLGPNHDWSSHGADAFGLIAVARPIINPALNDNDDWEEADLRQPQDIGRFGH